PEAERGGEVIADRLALGPDVHDGRAAGEGVCTWENAAAGARAVPRVPLGDLDRKARQRDADAREHAPAAHPSVRDRPVGAAAGDVEEGLHPPRTAHEAWAARLCVRGRDEL